MALDKPVDSTQLDSDLTSVANAIRTKGGTSASLAFPSGFVQAIGDIPTGGGGISFADYVTGTAPSGGITVKPTGNITPRGISGRDLLTELNVDFDGTYHFTSGQYFITDNHNLQRVIIRGLLVGYGLPEYVISSNNLLTQIIIRGAITGMAQSCFRANSALKILDIEKNTGIICQNAFYNCNSFDTLILRQSDSICGLQSLSVFNNCPFKKNGTGGTVYIPKTLYDHLGDGTSLDYQNASNWSTYYGYGTITWAKIEGSIYESLTWYES